MQQLEVVAHLTMPARYSEDAFMAELREDAFDFTRLSNRIASRDATLPTSELIANLRDDALHRWTPPGGGHHGALNHVVIHSLDITVPLGESPRASDTAIRTVLDDLTEAGGHAHFGTDIQGRSLHATDARLRDATSSIRDRPRVRPARHADAFSRRPSNVHLTVARAVDVRRSRAHTRISNDPETPGDGPLRGFLCTHTITAQSAANETDRTQRRRESQWTH